MWKYELKFKKKRLHFFFFFLQNYIIISVVHEHIHTYILKWSLPSFIQHYDLDSYTVYCVNLNKCHY